jgi:RNA polymerase sigma-70 factor (ECF subfamily)
MLFVFDRSDERRLACAIRAGDEVAYTAVIEVLRPPLLEYAYALTHMHDDAEDLVQDVLMRYWLKRDRLKPHRSIASYLFRAIRNAALDRLRHHYREHGRTPYTPDVLPAFMHARAYTALEWATGRELEDIVIEYLQRAPLRWQSAFLLCVVKQYTQAHTGYLLGLSRTVINEYLQCVRSELAHLIGHHRFRLPPYLSADDLYTKRSAPTSSYLALTRNRVCVSMRRVPEEYTPTQPFSSISVVETTVLQKPPRKAHNKYGPGK